MPFLLSLARLAVGLVALIGVLGAQEPAPGFDHAHERWSAVLAKCVRPGGVDYGALKAAPAELDAYLGALQAVTPEELARWSDPQRLAFWINAYNAHCLRKALEAHPKSIRRLDGAFGVNTVFDKPFVPMRAHHPASQDAELSLNDIQDGILRRRFRDARVHAALHNCTKSGPRLRAEAYTAEKLGVQLDEQMRLFVRDPARNRIDPEKGELALSEVFKWFAEDFERDARSLPEFLVRHAPAEQAEFLRTAKIRWLETDWELDDAPKD